MPEQPAPATAPEIAQAIREVRNEISAALTDGIAGLAGALKPGENVRDLPSDSLSAFTFPAPVVGVSGTVRMVDAQVNRTSVTLIAAAAGVWISAREGRVPGTYETVQLPANVAVTFNTRAAIYVGTDQVAPVNCSVVAEFATYAV